MEETLQQRLDKVFKVDYTWTKEDEKNSKYLQKILNKCRKLEYQILSGKPIKISWKIEEPNT